MKKLGRPVNGERKNVVTTITITEELSKKLNDYCGETGVPKSVLVRKLLVEFFEKQENKVE